MSLMTAFTASSHWAPESLWSFALCWWAPYWLWSTWFSQIVLIILFLCLFFFFPPPLSMSSLAPFQKIKSPRIVVTFNCYLPILDLNRWPREEKSHSWSRYSSLESTIPWRMWLINWTAILLTVFFQALHNLHEITIFSPFSLYVCQILIYFQFFC